MCLRLVEVGLAFGERFFKVIQQNMEYVVFVFQKDLLYTWFDILKNEE